MFAAIYNKGLPKVVLVGLTIRTMRIEGHRFKRGLNFLDQLRRYEVFISVSYYTQIKPQVSCTIFTTLSKFLESMQNFDKG
jgi:hypothetical protein